MAVLMLSVVESLLRQLRLSEAQLIALSDDPVAVADLFDRQRQLDRLFELSADHVEQSRSGSSAPRKRERRLGAQQDKAIRRFPHSPVSRSMILVRLPQSADRHHRAGSHGLRATCRPVDRLAQRYEIVCL